MAIGTQGHVENAYVSLQILRNKRNSNIPVTIFHWGNELPRDVMEHMNHQFGDVHFADLKELQAQSSSCDDKPNGFAIKGMAIGHASLLYEHLLWMDSDNFLLSDPEPLFNTSEYQKHGSLFWPDFFAGGVNPEIYEALSDDVPSTEADAESGQLIINTCKHNDVLDYVRVLNENADVTYKFMYGDKVFILSDTCLMIHFHISQGHLPSGVCSGKET